MRNRTVGLPLASFILVGFVGSAGAAQQGQEACMPGVVPCIPSRMLVREYTTLPVTGEAWTNIESWSIKPLSAPPLLNVASGTDDMVVLASALRWRMTGDTTYLNKVQNALQDIVGTEDTNCEAWEIAWNIVGYVVAADVIDYVEPMVFEPWLEQLRDQEFNLDSPNPSRHETFAEFSKRRPNNQGLACGLARLVIAMYLDHGDQVQENVDEVKDVKAVFHRWLGNTNIPDPGFQFNSCTAWIPPNQPARGINPVDASINGVNVDGAMPDDQRRIWECDPDNPNDRGCNPICGGSTPQCDVVGPGVLVHRTNYAWESMQSAVMTAHFLDRCRYKPFTWESQAIRRASDWLYDRNQFRPEEACDMATLDPCPATGNCCPQGEDCVDNTLNTSITESDDTWVPFITDEYYAQSRADHDHFLDGKPGKTFGFASWWTQGL